MENLSEEWRSVKGYEGYYEVSSLGMVRSLGRDVPCQSRWGTPRKFRMTGRIISTWKSRSGYLNVSLCAGDEGTNFQVHRLVAAAFIGDARDFHVNHKDGDKLNNTLPNLEYTTPKQNTAHAIATGLMCHAGEGNPSAKYSADQIRQAHALVLSGATYAKAAEITGVNMGSIVGTCHGKDWKSLNLPVIRRMQPRLQPAGA